MKRLFLLLFSISLLASLTFAQAGGAPNPGTPRSRYQCAG